MKLMMALIQVDVLVASAMRPVCLHALYQALPPTESLSPSHSIAALSQCNGPVISGI